MPQKFLRAQAHEPFAANRGQLDPTGAAVGIGFCITDITKHITTPSTLADSQHR